MRQLKDIINESFKKEYSYRIKLAKDCTADDMTRLESCLQKYNLVSASPFKRAPIQENPMEFVRDKGARFTSEVCSTDVVLKYPVNQRILEVYLAVNLNVPHERILCYGIKEPRRLEAEMAEERFERDQDRMPNQDDAVIANEDMAHYEDENRDMDMDLSQFGEGHSEKFVAELLRIRDEKGADYFRCYPTKDEMMGDNLRPTMDDLMNTPNMGAGTERTKEVDITSQSLGH